MVFFPTFSDGGGNFGNFGMPPCAGPGPGSGPMPSGPGGPGMPPGPGGPGMPPGALGVPPGGPPGGPPGQGPPGGPPGGPPPPSSVQVCYL